MKANFAAVMKAELAHEGGKVNDPHDPGGKTNQGVTQRVYTAWRQNQGLPFNDVYNMADHERDAIYRRQYWDKIRGDELPSGLDLVIMDGAVNSGPSQSVKWAQRAVGINNVDGILGDVTLRAIINYPNHDRLIDLICDRRLAFLQSLSTWKRFGKGWSSRVAQVRKVGQKWATGETSVTMNFVSADAGQKAVLTDAKKAPSELSSTSTTGGGIATASAGALLSQAKEALEPYTSIDAINKIVLALVFAGLIITAGGFIWNIWQKRKKAQRDEALDLIPHEG